MSRAGAFGRKIAAGGLMGWLHVGFGVAAAMAIALACPAQAETLKVGFPSAAPVAPIFIAKEKGYYAAEGLDVELLPFDAAGPIAVAVTSGAIDFALAGSTASFYSLAGQGAIQIIAGAVHEVPGFHAAAIVATNKGFEAGVKSLKDLGGRNIAMTQIGSSFYYALGLIAEKYGVDLKSIRIIQTQANANTVSTVAGGQVDAAVGTFTGFTPLLERHGAQLLGFVGDEAPWQFAVIITSTKTARDKPETVERWLKAFRNATRDYHDAFTNAAEQREDQASAPEILAIMSKYLNQTPEQIRPSIGFVDAEARLDVKDIHRQVRWLEAQGLVKSKVDADAIIASRYILPWKAH
jgi:NitT/TauT family transport system substrate-binding protein